MRRTSNDGAATQRPPSATEVIYRKRLLKGGLVQGTSGSGKTALMAEVARSVLSAERDRQQSGTPVREGSGDGHGLLSKWIRVLTPWPQARQRVLGEPVPDTVVEENPDPPEPAKVGALITGADGELTRAVVGGVPPERKEDLRVVDVSVLSSADLLTPPAGWTAEDSALTLTETLFDCVEFATYARGFVMDSLLALVIANQELVRRAESPRYSLMDLCEERFYKPRAEDSGSWPEVELPDSEAEREEYLRGLLSEVPAVRREVLDLVAVTLDDGPNQDLDDRRRLLRHWLGYTGSDRMRRLHAHDVSKRAAALTGTQRSEWAREVERRAANDARRTVEVSSGESRRIARIPPARLPRALEEGRIVLVEGMHALPGEEDPASTAKRVRYSWDCYTALSKAMLALASSALTERKLQAYREGTTGDLAASPVMVFADRLESDTREDGAVLQIPRFLSVLEQCGSGHTGVWAATRSMQPLGLTASWALAGNLSARAVFGSFLGGPEDISACAALAGVREPDQGEVSRIAPAEIGYPALKQERQGEDLVREIARYLYELPRHDYILADNHAWRSEDWCQAQIPGSPWGTRRARTVPLPE